MNFRDANYNVLWLSSFQSVHYWRFYCISVVNYNHKRAEFCLATAYGVDGEQEACMVKSCIPTYVHRTGM